MFPFPLNKGDKNLRIKVSPDLVPGLYRVTITKLCNCLGVEGLGKRLGSSNKFSQHRSVLSRELQVQTFYKHFSGTKLVSLAWSPFHGGMINENANVFEGWKPALSHPLNVGIFCIHPSTDLNMNWKFFHDRTCAPQHSPLSDGRPKEEAQLTYCCLIILSSLVNKLYSVYIRIY